MGIVLALLLVSTASAMILAGPRVLQVIGEDFATLAVLARTNRAGVPALAVGVQALLTLGFVLSGSFEVVLVFATFTLGLSTLATVAGVFVLRVREPSLQRPYRITGYPLPPIVFLALTGWTLAHICAERPAEAGAGVALCVVGVAVWWLVERQPRAASTSGGGVGTRQQEAGDAREDRNLHD
jgi:APA family basic amino acid/polyamine antiporter